MLVQKISRNPSQDEQVHANHYIRVSKPWFWASLRVVDQIDGLLEGNFFGAPVIPLFVFIFVQINEVIFLSFPAIFGLLGVFELLVSVKSAKAEEIDMFHGFSWWRFINPFVEFEFFLCSVSNYPYLTGS